MDVETLSRWLLERATTLYAHGDQLYVTPGGTAIHMHRVGEARCTDCNCAMCDDDMAQVLAAHEPELWEVLATHPYCATCYDVDTETWRPEWVAVDDAGRPYIVEDAVSAVPPTVLLLAVSDQEERRLVHILAALREHIHDEVTFLVDDRPDPRNTPLSERAELRLCAYLWNELTLLMEVVHTQEAARVDQHRGNPWL